MIHLPTLPMFAMEMCLSFCFFHRFSGSMIYGLWKLKPHTGQRPQLSVRGSKLTLKTWVLPNGWESSENRKWLPVHMFISLRIILLFTGWMGIPYPTALLLAPPHHIEDIIMIQGLYRCLTATNRMIPPITTKFYIITIQKKTNAILTILEKIIVFLGHPS